MTQHHTQLHSLYSCTLHTPPTHHTTHTTTHTTQQPNPCSPGLPLHLGEAVAALEAGSLLSSLSHTHHYSPLSQLLRVVFVVFMFHVAPMFFLVLFISHTLISQSKWCILFYFILFYFILFYFILFYFINYINISFCLTHMMTHTHFVRNSSYI